MRPAQKTRQHLEMICAIRDENCSAFHWLKVDAVKNATVPPRQHPICGVVVRIGREHNPQLSRFRSKGLAELYGVLDHHA